MSYLKKLREVYLNKNALWTDLPPDIGGMEDLGTLFMSEVKQTLTMKSLNSTTLIHSKQRISASARTGCMVSSLIPFMTS